MFKLVVCCQVRGPLSCTFGKSFVPGNRFNLWYKTSNLFLRVCPFSFNTYQDLTLPVLVCLSFNLFLYDARAKYFFRQAFLKMKRQRPTALQCHIFKIFVFSVPPNLVHGTQNLIFLWSSNRICRADLLTWCFNRYSLCQIKHWFLNGRTASVWQKRKTYIIKLTKSLDPLLLIFSHGSFPLFFQADCIA